MRISDWSSDVCSSDLTRRCLRPQRRAQARQARPNAPEGEMLMSPKDTLKTRRDLSVGGKTYSYYSLEAAAAELGDISRLPYSMKVLLENLLRSEDGSKIGRAS